MSFSTATTLIYTNGPGITAAAGTRLALQYTCQPDPKYHIWPQDVSSQGVHLTKCQPDP